MLSFLPCEAFTVCVELFITVITAFIWNTNHVKGCFGFVFLQILI